MACGGNSLPADGGTSDAADDFAAQPMYGAVSPDSGVKGTDAGQDATSTDGASDATTKWDGPIALYGAPPPPGG